MGHAETPQTSQGHRLKNWEVHLDWERLLEGISEEAGGLPKSARSSPVLNPAGAGGRKKPFFRYGPAQAKGKLRKELVRGPA